MPSVAARILTALRCRLLDIRGQGGMVNDLQGRVLLRRVSYDLDADQVPAVFVARRYGGGTLREQKPGAGVLSDTTITLDVIGVVARTGECGLEGEALLADLHRALEISDDIYLRDSALNKNLLSQELQIVDVQIEPPPDSVPFELVGVGVLCTYPHLYGDPDHVA